MRIFPVALLALSSAPVMVDAGLRAEVLDDSCDYNTYMCCWDENLGGDDAVQDNTDVCRSGRANQKGKYLYFPDEEEGKVHCHGIVWADGASFEHFIRPLFQYVNTFDHVGNRGYHSSVKRSPKCSCIEDMPVVTRADCTTYSSQGLVACENNDLRTHYEGAMGSPKGDLPTTVNLVGDCDNFED